MESFRFAAGVPEFLVVFFFLSMNFRREKIILLKSLVLMKGSPEIADEDIQSVHYTASRFRVS